MGNLQKLVDLPSGVLNDYPWKVNMNNHHVSPVVAGLPFGNLT
jgi:hypothetical protein